MSDFSLENVDYNINKLVIDEPILEFLQEITVLLETEPFEFIGNADLGRLNLKTILFKRSIRNELLIKTITNEINKHCYYANVFKFNIGVDYLKGTQRDIIVLTTTVYREDNTPFEKTFIYK